MAGKKAAVAGSAKGPAVADTAPGAESKPQADTAPVVESKPEVPAPTPALEAAPAAPAAMAFVAAFPREIIIANDAPMSSIVAATLIGPGKQVPIVVRSQDEITRIKTDCKHIMGLTPAYAELDPQPLRVIDAAAE